MDFAFVLGRTLGSQSNAEQKLVSTYARRFKLV